MIDDDLHIYIIKLEEMLDDLLEAHAQFLRDGSLPAKDDLRRLRLDIVDSIHKLTVWKELENLEEKIENLTDALKASKKSKKTGNEKTETELFWEICKEIYSKPKLLIRGKLLEVGCDLLIEVNTASVLDKDFGIKEILFKTTSDLAEKAATIGLYKPVDIESNHGIITSISWQEDSSSGSWMDDLEAQI